METIKLRSEAGLLVYKDDSGVDCCLGYLTDFKENEIYDAELGKIDISREVAITHNALLDWAMVKGLDESCEVGQGNVFYPDKDGSVKTFIGTFVAQWSKKGNKITFVRNGRTFEGTPSGKECAVFFVRVS